MALMHSLRLRLDSFFVKLFCIVFDILGVSGCTFGTAVAPWGAVGPPTRASPWWSTWFFGLLENYPHSWSLYLTFFLFSGVNFRLLLVPKSILGLVLPYSVK